MYNGSVIWVAASLSHLSVSLCCRDEKVTLISQISTLQGQQEALGSRLESLTQAADNAADREREAEDRLDNALTQHARQISQRQVSSFRAKLS